MKVLIQLTFLFIFLSTSVLTAQYGYGNNRYGRQQGGRSSIPQAQAPPKEVVPKTADEIVDEEMPNITKSVGLDPFEEAVVRSTLVKYLRKRMELQILEIEPQKMKEEFKKIQKLQDEDLKAGLPEEKYEAFQELLKNNLKAKKKKEKKNKKKKEKS